MNKNFLENIIPVEEKEIFGIYEEEILEEIITEEEEIEKEIAEEKTKIPIDKQMYQFLDEQLKDIKIGLLQISEEYHLDEINEFVENLAFDDPTWQNSLIIETYSAS